MDLKFVKFGLILGIALLFFDGEKANNGSNADKAYWTRFNHFDQCYTYMSTVFRVPDLFILEFYSFTYDISVS
jgi:hypothetical protein